MMNRFFPANFPNKQYQLLFTQGSGESKEGTLAQRSGGASRFSAFSFLCSLGVLQQPAQCLVLPLGALQRWGCRVHPPAGVSPPCCLWWPQTPACYRTGAEAALQGTAFS